MKRVLILLAATVLFTGCQEMLNNNWARVFKYDMGKTEIIQLTDLEAPISPSVLDVKDPMNYSGLMKDKGGSVYAVNSYMLRSKDKKYLFDTGNGGWMNMNLDGIGENFHDIEKIFMTDMHMDHIGGMVKYDRKTYPNAHLYIPQPEYDYWMSDEEMTNAKNKAAFNKAREVIEYYKDDITLFDPATISEGGTILEDGITAFHAPGRTPGHTIYLIESGKKKLLIWGDLTYMTEVQTMFPDISVIYDNDSKQAAATRREVMEFAATNNIPVAGAHIIYPGIGTLQKQGDGYLFKPVKARKRQQTRG